MGAYENPGPAVPDQSGQIWSQAVTNVGRAFARGMQNFAANQKKAKDEAEKTRRGNQTLWLNTELGMEKIHQSNLDKYEDTAKNVNLFEKFQDQSGVLLNGERNEDGEYIEGGNIGAKQARYRLLTEKNLTEEDKQKYLGVIHTYDNFMGTAKSTIGSIQGEAIEFDKYNRADVDRTFTTKGVGIEKVRNLYSYFALSGKPAPDGVTYDTDIYAGKKGENMIKAEITFDPESQSFLDLSEEFQKEIKDNGYKLNFDQDWTKWSKDGFFTPIQQGISEETVVESTNYKDENGNVGTDFKTDQHTSVVSSGDVNGITTQTQTTTSIFNSPLLNQETKGIAQARVKTIMESMTPEEQNDYVAYTLDIEGGSFNRNTTIIPGTEKTLAKLIEDGEAVGVFTGLEQTRFNTENLEATYGKPRTATVEEAARLNALNSKDKTIPQIVGGENGDLIYVEETRKTLSGATQYDKTGFDPSVKGKKILTRILKDPAEMTAEILHMDQKYVTLEGQSNVKGEESNGTLIVMAQKEVPILDNDGEETGKTKIVDDPQEYNLDNPSAIRTFVRELAKHDTTYSTGNEKGQSVLDYLLDNAKALVKKKKPGTGKSNTFKTSTNNKINEEGFEDLSINVEELLVPTKKGNQLGAPLTPNLKKDLNEFNGVIRTQLKTIRKANSGFKDFDDLTVVRSLIILENSKTDKVKDQKLIDNLKKIEEIIKKTDGDSTHETSYKES